MGLHGPGLILDIDVNDMTKHGYKVRLNSDRGKVIQALRREFLGNQFTMAEAVRRGIPLNPGLISSLRRDKIIESTKPGIHRPYVWRLSRWAVLVIETNVPSERLGREGDRGYGEVRFQWKE